MRPATKWEDTQMSKPVPIIVLAFALAAALSIPALALKTGEAAPAFKLADQFGKTWELSALKNGVVVLVAANKVSGRAMGPWVDNLKSKYGTKITLLGLMDLRGMPGFARGITRSRIKSETKDPLMIDFDGPTSTAYQVNDKSPVVVVIDRGGIVRAVEKDPYSKQTYAGITAAVDKALEPETHK